MNIEVLDHGFVRLCETWGHGGSSVAPDDHEAGIISAARQSTQGEFRGWEPGDGHRGDRRLLRYMYTHQHATPWEFAGLVVEVRAPIFVIRQWHRHRTQSYNEMSGRYGPVPELWYLPTHERVMAGAVPTDNRQASGTGAQLTPQAAHAYIESLDEACALAHARYHTDLERGVPKELARLRLPVNTYSQMRASASLRNWLGFLALRLDSHAQWEIRQYAEALATIIEHRFPETWALFSEAR